MHPCHQKYRRMHLSPPRHSQASNRSLHEGFHCRGRLSQIPLLLFFCFVFVSFQPCGKRSKGECFLDRVHLYSSHDCTTPTPPLHPLPRRSTRAAGWRSRRRQQIRRTQERGENGRRKRGVHSLTAEHNVLSCPPSALPLSPRHGCGALRADVGRLHKRNCARVLLPVKKPRLWGWRAGVGGWGGLASV